MIKVGNKIKKLRELKNYTQEYMAQGLAMTPAGYSKIERDETDLSISRLDAIAQILEVDISTILNFDARQIFNITNSHQNAIGNHEAHVYHNDKIIAHLENEIMYLRTENSRLLDLLNRDRT